MKILLECFISIESGPVFTYGLAKAMVENKVEVFAVLPHDIENRQRWMNLLGIERVCFINTFEKKKPLEMIKELFKVRKKYKGIIFDYVFATFPRKTDLLVSHCVKHRETIGILHDVIPHSSTDKRTTNKVRSTIAKFNNIVVLSKKYIPIVQKEYCKDSEHVLYLRHGAMEYPSLASICESEYKINYLYFGRIDGYKGLHVLAAAYKKLSKDNHDISLTIAGSGDFSDYEEEYEVLNNCKVDNRYLSDEDIAYYFGKPNTVVVLPYIDATQSGVIGMCFNYNTPVIVSDTGGLKEQLFDGEMGLFVSPGNSEDLYRKMRAFLDDKNLYSSQVELMKLGREKTTWNYVTNEFLKCIKNRESF